MAKMQALGSKDLSAVLRRVKGSTLSAADKAILSEMISQTIELKRLVEKATVARGKKKIVASLPFGFDIVK